MTAAEGALLFILLSILVDAVLLFLLLYGFAERPRRSHVDPDLTDLEADCTIMTGTHAPGTYTREMAARLAHEAHAKKD